MGGLCPPVKIREVTGNEETYKPVTIVVSLLLFTTLAYAAFSKWIFVPNAASKNVSIVDPKKTWL
ncbi:MAG: hypothetical protein ACK415_05930 [Thermodesulfovibrionales bacterium]